LEILKTLGIEPDVILVNIISFLLLWWLLAKTLVNPITGILKNRRDEIEGSYQRISDETAKAEKTRAELEVRLQEIEVEARARIEQAGAEAARMKDQMLAQARTEAEQVKERGIQEIERERDKALQSIRQHVADLVLQTSQKVIGASVTDATHRELISQTLDRLEGLKN